MKLLIYADIDSPRLRYVCHQVFGIWFGWEYDYTTNSEVFLRYEGVALNYSKCRIKQKEVFIPNSDFLNASEIHPIEKSFVKQHKIPASFTSETAEIIREGDLLAAIFFHLSRYEEYLAFDPDQHGRFTAQQSWNYKNGTLKIPIVDQLVQVLYQSFHTIFENIPPLKRTFTKMPTYDIDMAWAYLHKGVFRNIAGIAKQVQKKEWTHLKNRVAVITRQQVDPYQTFPLLETWHQAYHHSPIYFFLLGKYSTYDKNISPSNPLFRQLIQQIASQYPIGIHPSYLSNNSPQQLQVEIETLATISNQRIHRSRQHFLKLHLPTTYRQLLQNGIQQDYSMGYADAIGFRAGTSQSFYWYDLEKEERTELLVHPFQIMDVTLKEYLNLSPTEAMEEIKEMIDTIKTTKGTFCSLWHNSSFSYIGGWEEWKAVYEFLLEYGD